MSLSSKISTIQTAINSMKTSLNLPASTTLSSLVTTVDETAGAYKVSSITEMNSITNAKTGDTCVVFNKDYIGVSKQILINKGINDIKIPNYIVLSNVISNTFTTVSGDISINITPSLFTLDVNISGQTQSYTRWSNDGIHYGIYNYITEVISGNEVNIFIVDNTNTKVAGTITYYITGSSDPVIIDVPDTGYTISDITAITVTNVEGENSEDTEISLSTLLSDSYLTLYKFNNYDISLNDLIKSASGNISIYEYNGSSWNLKNIYINTNSDNIVFPYTAHTDYGTITGSLTEKSNKETLNLIENFIEVMANSISCGNDLSYVYKNRTDSSNNPILPVTLKYLDTTNCTNMSYMFSGNLYTTLDLSNFITSNVTNFSNMFYNCTALTTLDIRNFTINSNATTTDMFTNIPNNCLVIVKDDPTKAQVLLINSNLTNVKTVAEL